MNIKLVRKDKIWVGFGKGTRDILCEIVDKINFIIKNMITKEDIKNLLKETKGV